MVKLLCDRLRSFKVLMLPNETGMVPVKALWSSLMSCKLSQLPKVLGIGPDKLFDGSRKLQICELSGIAHGWMECPM